ncbi:MULTISPECIES: hypothetical protein [Streptomyces]|uniref:Uncharacterized protein n=1 Tax=Streptomyces chengmaiensis TaxID=3040919 RepID=A0ABT6HL40_9ACTN|nr:MULTISPECIES: hypothetical protein [Streptomyces]MDH2389020.1 hypothetical protein [Streptomyces chengmaiensis]WRQ82698.1 hypothetical protein I3F59_026975 [Streptomyces sp. MUM 178J]
MFLSLPTLAWVAIAVAVTPAHIALMRWSMPTPKAKQSVSFVPLPVAVSALAFAAAKGYMVAEILYLYSAVLVMFVVMIAPVRKWVGADIAKQEDNPDIKVKAHAPSLWWIFGSGFVMLITVMAVWSAGSASL